MRTGPFTLQDHWVITTLGLEFAVAVGMCAAGGYYIDKHFQSFPWGMVLGVLVGFALGMYIVIKEAKRMERAAEQTKDNKKNGSI